MRDRKHITEILLLVKLNGAHNGVSNRRLALLGLFVRNVGTTSHHVPSSQLLQRRGTRLL